MTTLEDDIDTLFAADTTRPVKAAASLREDNTKKKKRRKKRRVVKRTASNVPKAQRKKKKRKREKVHAPVPVDAALIRTFTVPSGTRKSKARKRVAPDLEAAAADIITPTEARSLPPPPLETDAFANMPCLDGPFALDDWLQRYRNGAAQTAPIADRRRSIAAAIRESLVEKEVVAAQESESSDTDDDGEDVKKEIAKEITVEDFFSGDVDTPLMGSAATMYEMLAQLRTDIETREAISKQVAIANEAHIDTVRKPKKKRRRKSEKKKDIARTDHEVVAEVAGDDLVLRHLEPCSKAYCADFFREPRGEEFGERECRRDADCIFMLLAARYPDSAVEATNAEGFVCREFLRPSELDGWVSTGKLPASRRLCLGCERLLTTFYYYLHQTRGESPVELIQTHYNLIDEPGEYDAARCLYPNPDAGKWTGIARPFVEFTANTFVPVRFELVSETTKRKWLLLGAREEMTDFRLSPSRYDMAAAEEAAEAEIRRGGENSSVEAAANGGFPQDPRGAWVAGTPGAVACGVPPCRPLRPAERIEAERLADPPVPGQLPPSVLVPRVLLGQAHPTMAAYVFCPFADTLARARDDASSVVIALTPKLDHETEMYSFGSDLLRAAQAYGATQARVSSGMCTETEKARAMAAPRYAILLTVLYRIEFAMRLMGGGEDRRYDYWLQLFVDTHIDLCSAMHETGLFDDAALESAHDNPSSLCDTLLEQNWPHDTRCAHAGDLPDLSACIQFASVWFQVRAKAQADNVAEALIHLIACKTQTHKCQVRNFAHIAFAYAEQFPQIMTLFRALISVSLLGNYPHARKRPDFAARLHITFSTRRVTATDRTLFLWIADNEQLMYAIVKEYYRYLVSHRPAFEAVLEETTHWETVREYIRDAMDRARAAVELACAGCTLSGAPYGAPRQGYAGHGAPLDMRDVDAVAKLSHQISSRGATARNNAAMRTISDDMHDLHEFSELPLITKLRKGTFTNMILPEMTRFFKRDVLNEHIVRPQTSLVCLSTLDGTDAAVEIVRAMRLVVESRVPQRDSREPIELGWLGYLGVTRDGLADLRALCYDYETKDIADNSINERIRAIFNRSKRDFFVMHTFFKIVADWRATANFTLPLCYAQTQGAALRAKTFTPPWAPLHPEADVFKWCPSCQKWLSDIIKTDEPATRARMYSANLCHALYSHATDRTYCDWQNVAVNTRKQVESGRYTDVDAYVDDVSEARRVRHYLSKTRCCSVPAVSVHMLGRCQRLDGKMWALCECCGVLTQWDGSKFGPSGFTCGFHSTDAPRTLTAHQVEVARLRELRSQLPPAERCSFCRNELKPGEDYAQTTVLDDCGEYLGDDDDGNPVRSTPTWTYLPFVLCRVDGNAVREWHKPIVRRSILEKGIRRTRHWRMLNSMKRFGHPGL